MTLVGEAAAQGNLRIRALKVMRSLDHRHGFDRAAIDAMKQWRFRPGVKDDRPVPVRINTETTFSTR